MTTDHRNTRILAELFSYLASDMEEVNLNAILTRERETMIDACLIVITSVSYYSEI